MVVFLCVGCNDSLKRNQVARHLSVCRRGNSVSSNHKNSSTASATPPVESLNGSKSNGEDSFSISDSINRFLDNHTETEWNNMKKVCFKEYKSHHTNQPMLDKKTFCAQLKDEASKNPRINSSIENKQPISPPSVICCESSSEQFRTDYSCEVLPRKHLDRLIFDVLSKKDGHLPLKKLTKKVLKLYQRPTDLERLKTKIRKRIHKNQLFSLDHLEIVRLQT